MSAADVDGRERPQRRYPAQEPHDPQEVSDPHTTTDETDDGWRAKYLPDWGRVGIAAAGIAAFAILGYGVFLFGGTVIAALQNRYVQLGIGGVTLLGLGVVFGASRERSAVAETDTLTVMLPNTALDVPGEYVELGEEPAFIPYKGRTGILRSQRQFTVNELAEEYPALTSKNLEGDQGAVIMLWNAFTSTAVTDRGVAVVTLADDFEGTPYTDGTTHKARPPVLAQEERLEDATQTITELDDEIQKLEREVGSWQNRVEDLAAKLGDRRDEIKDEMVDLHKDLQEAHAADDGRRHQQQADPAQKRQMTSQFFANGGGEDS